MVNGCCGQNLSPYPTLSIDANVTCLHATKVLLSSMEFWCKIKEGILKHGLKMCQYLNPLFLKCDYVSKYKFHRGMCVYVLRMRPLLQYGLCLIWLIHFFQGRNDTHLMLIALKKTSDCWSQQ